MRLLFAVLVGLVLWSSPAQAQRLPDVPEVCLPLQAHQAILADLRELRGDGSPDSGGLRQRVRLLEQKLELQTEQLHDFSLARDLAVHAQEAAVKGLEAAVRGKREAEEQRDAWHRAPVVWFAVGVVGALVVAITVDKIQTQ